MAEHTPKKMLIINILDILKKYTDYDHRLSQKEIIDILKKEYDMVVDRKSIKRNITNLIDYGYDINYTETKRMYKNKKGEDEESYILSDFYISREFSNSELRLLIDSLLFSQYIPYSQCKELVKKLEGLSNNYFHSKVKHISLLEDEKINNRQLFYNIDILDEAIEKGRQVKFKYCSYGIDKELHKRKNDDGEEREYIINPYQMVVKEGKYYLICNYDKYEYISNYRLDRISNIELLDTPIKPFEKLKGANGRHLNLKDYMREHVYMFSSNNTHARFRITKSLISDVIDLFGKDVRFENETDDTVEVVTYTNEMALHQFAKAYSPYAIVLEPKQLASAISADLEKAVQIYNKQN